MNTLKRKIFLWLFSKLKDDDTFNNFFQEKMEIFYANKTLETYRVWGEVNRLTLGKETQVNNALFNTVSGDIMINDYAFFGHNVCLLTGTHDYNNTDLDRQHIVPSTGRDIVIGRGVWIASNVTVIGPCNIGDNAVIGVGSLVTGDIQENSFYAGSPAKFKKKIEV